MQVDDAKRAQIDKWSYIVGLDDELLKGGAMSSAKIDALVQSADLAYCGGAPIACIVLAAAAIEGHLRFDLSLPRQKRFSEIIHESDFDQETKENLHLLRKERNRWVHANDEGEADEWLYNDIAGEDRLDGLARKALRLLRIVLYDNPWI